MLDSDDDDGLNGGGTKGRLMMPAPTGHSLACRGSRHCRWPRRGPTTSESPLMIDLVAGVGWLPLAN